MPIWLALATPGCYFDWSKPHVAQDAAVADAVSTDARADVTTDAPADAPTADAPAADVAAPDQQSLLQSGAACASDTACESNHCVDGVCCAAMSCGVCYACNIAGSEGTCAAVPLSKDPKDDCPDDPLAGCGYDGTCDGKGACRKYAAGTICELSQCTGLTALEPQSLCDGAGSCVAQAPVQCDPYKCDTTTGTCFTSCTESNEGTNCGFYRCDSLNSACYSDCTTDNQATNCKAFALCIGGKCEGGLVLGTACTSDIQCSSGHCVDGVCCASSCTSTCYACNLAGKEGTCTIVPAGQDPRDDCTQIDPPSSCGFDGTCDGMGGCRQYGATTQCAAASCTSGDLLAVPAKTCDASGTCTGSTAVDCDPYRCDPTVASCFTSCTSAEESTQCSWYRCDTTSGSCFASCTAASQSTTCQSIAACVDGRCVPKLQDGEGCSSSTQCASGNCRDGVCCNTTCQDKCYACNLAGKEGICSVVPGGADPRDDCSQDPAATCGNDGTCDGAGGCRRYLAGTVCQAAACKDLTEAHAAWECDGKGVCQPQAIIHCDPYACNPATVTCFTSCTASNQDIHCGWSQCDAPTSSCWASCTLQNEDQRCKPLVAECSNGECISSN